MVAGSNRVTQRLSDSQFEALADETLAALERAFDASGVEADVQAKGAGVLEIEFEGGERMVINRHGAARELWVAARSGGLHFRHDGAAWRDTRSGEELFAAVSRIASALGGAPVVLSSRAP
jgi:CyaY protein